MHIFDVWLLERLVAVGALRLDDPQPDVPAAILLYQESKGIAETGKLDFITVYELRRDWGSRPGVDHVVFFPLPSPIGSAFYEETAQ